jgi:hypothetical protein
MLAAVLLTAGCASSVGTANTGGTVTTGTTGSSSAAQSFETFLADVSSATYQNYANLPGARVRDASAFQQMREYVLTRYQGVRVTQSFTDGSGAVFDCVQQPTATADTATITTGACPTGTIPTRRITLTDLVRFPTLQQFLSKSPGGTGQLPLPPSSSSR